MAQLPDHLIYLIFLKLPVKTLLRFRCVSKLWNETITSSSFAKQQMKSAAACCNFFYSKASACNYFFPLLSVIRISSARQMQVTGRVADIPFRVEAAGVRRAWIHHSSCNGLLFMIELGKEVSSSFIRVWNPATRKHKEVAWPPSFINMNANVLYSLVGFGYAPGVDDHKIVVMCDSGDGWRIQTLSLKTNAWRAVVAPPCLDFVRGGIDQQMNSVAVDGHVYWMVDHKASENEYYDYGLLKFDLEEESVQVLPFPEGLSRRRDSGMLQKLGHYNGSLCLYKWELGVSHYLNLTRSGAMTKKIDIWMLQGHATWCKLVTVPTMKYQVGTRRGGGGGGRRPTRSQQHFQPVGFDCNGHLIVVNRLDHSLVAYLPGENKFVWLSHIYLDEGGTRPHIRGSWDLHFVRMETLVSP